MRFFHQFLCNWKRSKFYGYFNCRITYVKWCYTWERQNCILVLSFTLGIISLPVDSFMSCGGRILRNEASVFPIVDPSTHYMAAWRILDNIWKSVQTFSKWKPTSEFCPQELHTMDKHAEFQYCIKKLQIRDGSREVWDGGLKVYKIT